VSLLEFSKGCLKLDNKKISTGCNNVKLRIGCPNIEHIGQGVPMGNIIQGVQMKKHYAGCPNEKALYRVS